MVYSIKTDEKWQAKWEQENLYKFDENRLDKKLYCLEMFSDILGKYVVEF